MEKEILVSVIMPAFNTELYISEAIESILNQTYPHFELLIADDGSIDQTLSIIKSYQDPRIRLIEHKTNKGNVETMNALFRAAKGEYIMIQDADDYSTLNRLAVLLNFMLQNPNVDVVGSSYVKFDGFGHTDTYHLPVDLEEIRLKFDQMQYPLPVLNGCCLFKSIIVKEEVLYRSLPYLKRGQDDDWLFRLSEKFLLGNVPDALYYYRSNPESTTLNIKHINLRTLFVQDFILYLKEERNRSGNDYLERREMKLIDSFFTEKEEEVLSRDKTYLEKYIANKYFLRKQRIQGFKWLLLAALKNITDIAIWKRIAVELFR
jgi:glycosyltransferase involved in cell wall biosynthesis